MTNETDEMIAASVQSGETEAFSQLVERYENKLMRYARKFLRDPDDAKDIVQEVFIKAYENIQSFDASRRFSPWIYRIAHNEFVNAIKKRARGPVLGLDFDVVFPHLTAGETADEAALERDTKAILEECLDELDAKYREPLILYYFEGLSYKDIADVLRIPMSTVGVRLARGKAQLQKVAAKKHLYD
ncbi:MAG TPA: RNA polymerase sigma factor [Candidatus Paceibacterota bacterium]|jgi:RNA polymerase sigma-70 factor (ECF subfamily)|nr:RNA polymerase sigma factor [Candidatus Paceibacterota bacterium]